MAKIAFVDTNGTREQVLSRMGDYYNNLFGIKVTLDDLSKHVRCNIVFGTADYDEMLHFFRHWGKSHGRLVTCNLPDVVAPKHQTFERCLSNASYWDWSVIADVLSEAGKDACADIGKALKNLLENPDLSDNGVFRTVPNTSLDKELFEKWKTVTLLFSGSSYELQCILPIVSYPQMTRYPNDVYMLSVDIKKLAYYVYENKLEYIFGINEYYWASGSDTRADSYDNVKDYFKDMYAYCSR